MVLRLQPVAWKPSSALSRGGHQAGLAGSLWILLLDVRRRSRVVVAVGDGGGKRREEMRPLCEAGGAKTVSQQTTRP